MLKEEQRVKVLEAKKRFYDHFFNKEGFNNIAKEDLSPPDNENPTLFLAEIFYLLHYFGELNHEDKMYAQLWIDRIRVRDNDGNITKGYFHRSPGTMEEAREEAIVSHDEYTGICILAVLIDRIDIIHEIIQAGLANGFSYNDHYPEKVGRIEKTRQGIHVAFYKWLAGLVPTVWNVAWFMISGLWTVFRPAKKKDDGTRRLESSGIVMMWLRLEMLKDVNVSLRLYRHVWLYLMNWRVSRAVRKNRFDDGGSTLASVSAEYFVNPRYPLHDLASVWDELN